MPGRTDRSPPTQGAAPHSIVEVSSSSFYGNFGADLGGAIYMESVGVALQDIMMDRNACEPVRGVGGGLASEPCFLIQVKEFQKSGLCVCVSLCVCATLMGALVVGASGPLPP